ncbi:MAG: hypothetical protein SPJ42_02270, partial [Oscillospiraceae bacterium]|nr:hypothetical protein [Oscillospiraceae bacterium]
FPLFFPYGKYINCRFLSQEAWAAKSPKTKRGCRNKMKKPFSSDARRREKPNRKKRLKRNINNLILIPNKKIKWLVSVRFPIQAILL